MPDVVGTAYVTIRAITSGIAKDIEDGVKKGAGDADVDKSGKDVGGKFAKGFGDSVEEGSKKSVQDGLDKTAKDSGVAKSAQGAGQNVSSQVAKGMEKGGLDEAGKVAGDHINAGIKESTDKETSKVVSESVKKVSHDKDVEHSSNLAGRTVSKHISKGMFDGKGPIGKTFKDMMGGVLGAFQFPSNKFDWIGILGVNALGGAIQLAMSSLGTLTTALGQLVFASAGAGVAMGGTFAALAVGLIPIMLAFKSTSAEAKQFKAQAGQIIAPIKQMGDAAMHTMAPGLLASLRNLQKLRPALLDLGADQGALVGGIARMATATLTSNRNLGTWKQGLKGVHEVFTNLGAGAVNLSGALPTVFAAAMPVAGQFSEAVGKLATRFSDFITKTGTSKLSETFQGWYDKAAQVFRTLGNVAQGLGRILKIGSDSGGDSMFTKFEDFSKKFDHWAGSIRGRNELRDFFGRSRAVMHEVSQIIGSVGKALFEPLQGAAKSTSIIGTLETIRQKWIPPLHDLILKIRETQKLDMGNIVDQIGQLLKTVASNPELVSSALRSLTLNMTTFGVALKILNTILGSGVGRAIINFLGPVIPLFFAAQKLKLFKLAGDVVKLAKAFGLLQDIKMTSLLTGFVEQFSALDISLARSKENFSAFRGGVQGAIGLVSGYMIGMSKDAATMALGIGASLANIGFAIAKGDWITAGIATVTTGIGLIAGLWKKHSDEQKKKAAEIAKSYAEIGSSLSDSFKTAFDEVGTTAASKRSEVFLKAMHGELDKGGEGAKKFGKAYHVSMADMAKASEMPIPKMKAWTKQLQSDEIQRVMHGNSQSTKIWGDEMKTAGAAAADAMSKSSIMVTQMGDASANANQGTTTLFDGINRLGERLAKGGITWDQYAARLKAAHVPMEDINKASQAYQKTLNTEMSNSKMGQFLDVLPGKLRDSGRAFMQQKLVEDAYAKQQLANGPPQDRINAKFDETKGKLDAVAQAYIRVRTASGELATTWAQSSTSMLSSFETILGNPKTGITGLGNGFFDNQQKILLMNQATESIAPTIASMAKASNYDLGSIQKGVAGLRTQFETGLKEKGIDPTTDAAKAMLDQLFAIPKDIAVKAGLTTTENGTETTSAQAAANLKTLNTALAKNNGLSYTTYMKLATDENGKPLPQKEINLNIHRHQIGLSKIDGKGASTHNKHTATENGKPTPLSRLKDENERLRAKLAKVNGQVANSHNKHKATENGKPKTITELRTENEALERRLKILNKRIADTHTRHKADENGKSKSTPTLASDADHLGGRLKALHGRTASTATRHAASENGKGNSTRGIAGDTDWLGSRLGALHGKRAESHSNTSSTENGTPTTFSVIGSDLGGIGSKLDGLNNKHSTAYFDLHAKMFADAQSAAIMSNPAILKSKGLLTASGGYFAKPTVRVIGEAGPEIVLPITDQVRSVQLLSKYAPQLAGAKGGAGLDRLLAPGGRMRGGSVSGRSGPSTVTGVHIDNATFNTPADADLVAARLRASLRLLGVA